MSTPTAFLARPGSTLGERVAARVRGECCVLEAGDPRVSIEGRSVIWNGRRLDELHALIVEAPLISWPQPVAEGRAGELARELQRRGMARRERTALHVAALRILAGHVRVANEPALAAEFASAPAIALERLSAAGVPVRLWRLTATPGANPGASIGANDRVARLAPTAECGPRAADGTLGLEVELAAAGATAHLCVGGRWIAATRSRPGIAATRSQPELVAPPSRHELAHDATSDDRDLALRALAELGLEFGCVHLSDDAVAFVDAAVDLQAWDLACDGSVAEALASWLVRTQAPTT